jgi:hypothetical protein
MFSKLTIAVALLVYLAVIGCVLLPGQTPATAQQTPSSAQGAGGGPVAPIQHRDGLPIRAVGMQIQRVDWIDKYKKSVDEIAALGADAVKFVVDARQENGTSGRIYLDMRMCPTPDQLGELIRYAKSKNLRVILMPIVLLDKPRGNEWRGTLKPESWAEWFDSYRDILGHFAWIAQGNGVDVFVVGSELVSSETKLDEWTKTIRHVRGIYKGRLTYSSNWDHYTVVPFWDQLDLIGMNSYWKLGNDNKATVEDIVQSWRAIQGDLLPFVQRSGKPLMFLEIGWCSMSNAAHEPWDYTTGDPIDLELQKRLYQGFFQAWYGNQHLGGFSVWEWTPDDGGPDNRGYTPKNKPAEQVLREWMAKPAWQVK